MLNHKLSKVVLLIFLLSGLYVNGRCQLVINEFMASNSSVISDPEFHNFSDWIELYNSGNSDINLNGYYITDNLNRPDKWKITTDAIIPANGFLLIWADGDSIGLHTPYKLAQEGEEIGLFSPTHVLIDSITYSAQYTDISYGRQTDGNSTWGFFTESTPGASNNTVSYIGLVDNVPEFSLFGGIYNSSQQVELSTPFGGTIRYTTDGSAPIETSTAYLSPIQINSTTILRARVFKPNLIPGRIVTNSYFINEGIEDRGLPVFSIATDPENFWDPEIGIYVQDFKPEWEVPVNIELFENDGSDRAAFNEPAGTKVNGLYSWQLPQKMLGIYFRKQYGSSRLAYPLIFDCNRAGYKTFALRASGSDWSYTMFRDAMLHMSTLYNMNIDIMGYRPSILYVNGQYMGIHNIREKIEENYIMEHYGLEEGTFDMVENEDYAEAGDLLAYNDFRSTYRKDLSIQSNYNTVIEQMDIQNFTDYIATEIYSGNYSIDHNVMAWKSKDSGKWKWILMDLDRGFFNPADYLINFYTNRSNWPLGYLMQNPGFREYFGRRLADHLYTTFNPERIKQLIDYHQQLIEEEMPYHIARWLGTTSSYGDAIPSMNYWYEQIANLKDYADARPGVIMADLQNYGFSAPANLTLSVTPANGGYIIFNTLRVPGPICSGPYLMNAPIDLVAIDKPGYDFVGWTEPVQQSIITKGDEWRYLDNGSNQGSVWHDTTFNDTGWQTGLAEFGYGDGDEQTIISYGGDANNKFITTYFRKSFELSVEDLSESTFLINLLRDDGAVVFLNGDEIIRSNMPVGNIGYQTLASSSVSGSSESEYLSYTIDPGVFKTGNNVLAVEIHQSASNSSDISFDLELVEYRSQVGTYISTDKNFSLTLNANRELTAVYISNGECILPESINTDLTLEKDCSPYVAQGDVTIAPGATLTIEPGVEIRMAEKGNMFIYGGMQAIGTEQEPIRITINPIFGDTSWGALCFINSADTSDMAYVTIEHSSEGPDPVRFAAAVSGFNSHLKLDHMTIENVDHNPIAGRYSSIFLTNSSLHSEIAGSDLINVKYGFGRIENCMFRGNEYSDVDAIDYDNVTNGIIKNCIIIGNQGFNSDAIDIGEKATNIMIDSVLIYNISDKGISVGQQSTVSAKNCVIVNCNLGFGVKDSSTVHIDHCTFYGVGKPIACFEKNPGEAGGNIYAKNCVLSNSYDSSYFVDYRSQGQISHSISDNDELPSGIANLFANPRFVDPNNSDFQFMPSSPCLTGSTDGLPMGSLFYPEVSESSLQFSMIYCNAENNPERSEFLGITNPSTKAINLLGFIISIGINYEFQQSTTLAPGETIYLVKNDNIILSSSYPGQVVRWNSGKLANEGETIRLTDKFGIVRDQVAYSDKAPWPDYSSADNAVLQLISPDLDNHFGDNWKILDYSEIVHINNDSLTQKFMEFRVFPNPSTGIFYVEASDFMNENIYIYDVTGKLINTGKMDDLGYTVIDLSDFKTGVYFIRVKNNVKKLMLIKP